MRSSHQPSKESRPNRGLGFRIIGFLMVGLGVIVIAAVGAYYGYRTYAHSQLDDLNSSVSGPFSLPPDARMHGFEPIAAGKSTTVVGHGSTKSSVPTDSTPILSQTLEPPNVKEKTTIEGSHVGWPSQEQSQPDGLLSEWVSHGGSSGADTSILSLYSEDRSVNSIHPKYWAQPLWAGSDRLVSEPPLPDGYRPTSSASLFRAHDRWAYAHTILIPLINVESSIEELRIIDLGDSRSYETPNNIVGHIPSTSNPGEQGSGWFFGHLESPIRGEGNVFSRLPDIPGLLKDGDPVYITMRSADGDFLYRVTDTLQIHGDDLRLFDLDQSSIVLVSCVPRLVYDHRLLVTATLIGLKKAR